MMIEYLLRCRVDFSFKCFISCCLFDTGVAHFFKLLQILIKFPMVVLYGISISLPISLSFSLSLSLPFTLYLFHLISSRTDEKGVHFFLNICSLVCSRPACCARSPIFDRTIIDICIQMLPQQTVSKSPFARGTARSMPSTRHDCAAPPACAVGFAFPRRDANACQAKMTSGTGKSVIEGITEQLQRCLLGCICFMLLFDAVGLIFLLHIDIKIGLTTHKHTHTHAHCLSALRLSLDLTFLFFPLVRGFWHLLDVVFFSN